MDKFPNGLISFVPELPLQFCCGESMLGGRKKMHGDEPIPEREFGAVHDGVRPEALPVPAVCALEAFLR